MSRSDDFSSGPPDGHVTEELPALVAGELDLDATRDVTTHLRSCVACREELVEVAAGIGLMRRLDGFPAGADDARRTPAPTASSARRRRVRSTLLAAAAAIVLLAGVVTAGVVIDSGGESPPEAKVELTPVANASADGTVAMRTSGSAQAMEVDTSLGAPPADHYYEVWLLDQDSGRLVPVGVLPPDGRGTFRLPPEILGSYDAVDISLQPDDGSTDHSSDSVLRAPYA